MTETIRKPSEEKPWRNVLPSGNVNDTVPELNAYRFMLKANENNMNGVALIHFKTPLKFKKLANMVEEYAASFKALGVKEGDLVSFISLAVPDCIASVYALSKIGATANMIDPRMDEKSIADRIKKSNSKVLIVLDAVLNKVMPILDDVKQDHVLIHRISRHLSFMLGHIVDKRIRQAIGMKIPYGTKNITKWEDFIAKGSGKKVDDVPYQADATVAITYTGGTTGVPKGVMITNQSMNAVALNFMNWGIDYKPGQRFLGIIPIFSSYGMVCGMHMPLCMNQQLIPIAKFNPAEFGKLIKNYRPNHMISTPAFYEMMMNSEEVKGLDMSFVITLGSGGDTMNEGLEQKLRDFMKEHNIRYPLAQGYGMSELSAAATFGINDVHKTGSVGIPSPNTTIGIFDPETGEELTYNQNGEICITGPSMMKGYWNMPEETANIMRKHDDGKVWIHSGDIGYIDEEGFLFVVGRIKRMITRFDGHKVFPSTIEGVIVAHEAVSNSSVVAVKDLDHGQGDLPIAFIEVLDRYDRDKVCEEIMQKCLAECEERGRPVAIVAIDAIPITGMGKNDYRTLEKQYYNYDYKKKV